MAKSYLSQIVAGGGINLPLTKAGVGTAQLGVDTSGNVGLFGPGVALIDAGSAPVTAFRSSVTVAGVVPGQAVQCEMSGDIPNGLAIDEFELEPLLVYGAVTAANQITFQIVCANLGGVFTGQRKINYNVG